MKIFSFYCFLAFMISICLLIETTTWILRSYAGPDESGKYIARTNIYLYGGRFFSLFFGLGASFMVDAGISTSSILLVIASAILSASISHLLISRFEWVLFKIAFLLKLEVKNINKNKIDNNRLKRNSTISTFIFSFGLTIPYIIASRFPDLRMTLSNLGQIINALGTLILLFIVDPILYKEMDSGNLRGSIYSFVKGRTYGLLLGSLLLILIYLFL